MKYKTYGENVFNIDEKAFLAAWQKDDQFKFVYENSTVVFIVKQNKKHPITFPTSKSVPTQFSVTPV